MTVDFEFWYRAEYPRLVNTLAMVTGDQVLASDAAAEACIKALGQWKRVGAMDRPGGWVYRVALNEAKRRARRKAMEQKLLAGQAAAPTPPPPSPYGDLDLWAAVAGLPERTKEAVVLRYVADLTEPEIARALGVARGTVATMLRRAHAALAEQLGSEELGAGAQIATQELTDVYIR